MAHCHNFHVNRSFCFPITTVICRYFKMCVIHKQLLIDQLKYWLEMVTCIKQYIHVHEYMHAVQYPFDFLRHCCRMVHVRTYIPMWIWVDCMGNCLIANEKVVNTGHILIVIYPVVVLDKIRRYLFLFIYFIIYLFCLQFVQTNIGR